MTTLPGYNECLYLLTHYSVPKNVINHLIFTTQNALIVAKHFKEKKFSVDCDLILAGAMLHDIGRYKSHNINHGIIGAQLLRKRNYPEKLARIIETHLFAGITRDEAIKLNLPPKDFIPVSLEEKIVTYADNISKGKKSLTINEVVKNLSKYLDISHPIILRVIELHKEIESILNQPPR